MEYAWLFHDWWLAVSIPVGLVLVLLLVNLLGALLNICKE